MDRPHYSLDDDLNEAEADNAARNLPEQIEIVRKRIRAAKARLSGEYDDNSSAGGTQA